MIHSCSQNNLAENQIGELLQDMLFRDVIGKLVGITSSLAEEEGCGLNSIDSSLGTYAPINVKPHYPPPGLTRGLVGDFDLI